MRNFISQSIDFGRDGNSREFLISGWSLQEDQHIWSVNDVSTICLPSPRDAPFGFFIELDWQPALRLPYVCQQIVEVRVNGRFVKSFSVCRSGLLALMCPPLPFDEHRIVITFYHPNSFSPSESGSSADTRKLALCFRRLRILTLLEPWTLSAPVSSSLRIYSQDPLGMIAEAERLTSERLSNILNDFEQLAGNCDMGLSLRHLNFEKMSFLRFGGASPYTAVKGLDTDFDGISQSISAVVANNPMREWLVSDDFGLLFHSGQSSDRISEEKLLARHKIHIDFLRRKFLEDLADESIIFVYADHREHTIARSLEEVIPLYLALRRRSRSSLLWVRPASNDPSLRGSAKAILPGLAVGYLDILAAPILVGGAITVAGWLTVLCNAWLAFRAEKAA